MIADELESETMMDGEQHQAGSGPVEPVGEAAEQNASGGLTQADLDQLTTDIVAALKTVYDPEIPVDIYELGLIYRVDVDDDRNITVDMTLTAPACPVAGEMPIWVENAVAAIPGVNAVDVNMVFDPPWDPGRMSEEAQVALGIF